MVKNVVFTVSTQVVFPIGVAPALKLPNPWMTTVTLEPSSVTLMVYEVPAVNDTVPIVVLSTVTFHVVELGMRIRPVAPPVDMFIGVRRILSSALDVAGHVNLIEAVSFPETPGSNVAVAFVPIEVSTSALLCMEKFATAVYPAPPGETSGVWAFRFVPFVSVK